MSESNESTFPKSLEDVSGSMYNGDQAKTKQYTETAATPAYDVADEAVKTEPNYQILLISVVVIAFIFLLFKPCRDFCVWVVTNIMLPALAWFFQTGSIWIVWLFKNIVGSHIDFIRHLSTPRSIIFPSLDDQRSENDKSINRKVEKPPKKKKEE